MRETTLVIRSAWGGDLMGRQSIFNLISLFIIIFCMSVYSDTYLQSDLFTLTNPSKTVQIKNRYTLQSETILKARTFDTPIKKSIYGLSVNGTVNLFGEASLVRVLLIDDNHNEYLVFEINSLLASEKEFTINSIAEESKLLNNVVPKEIRIVTMNGQCSISHINYSTTPIRDYNNNVRDLRKEQHNAKITALNIMIPQKGMNWKAGETFISLQTHEEKKCTFGKEDEILPNLQGFEYYVGGVFEVKSDIPDGSIVQSKSREMIPSFDWRERHGATDSNSPYYEKDHGWATSIKTQGSCGSCWSHSTLATAEMMANLYYNQHIDLDLAEQYLMACSCPEVCEKPGKPCSGGWSTEASKWLVKNGVTDEKNFPYVGTDGPSCGDSASNPEEHFAFSDGQYLRTIPSQDSLKSFLIHNGPLNVEILSMWHCMSLVGYKGEAGSNNTIWIYKNSHGSGSGEDGYGLFKTKMNDIRSADCFMGKASSLNYTDDDIKCQDLDNDGYYNWGIGDKPAHCPECPDEPDCDDSRNDRGPMNDDGSCKKITVGRIPFVHNNRDVNFTKNSKGINLSLNFDYKKSISVKVYDLSGKEMRSMSKKSNSSKSHSIQWKKSHIAKGIYIFRVFDEKAMVTSFRAVVGK